MKKKILITGATGFLGFRLIEFLRNQYEITGTGRNEETGQMIRDKNIRFISINLENKEETETGLRDIYVDCIIHLAAKSSLWGDYEDFYKTNVTGTKNILDYATKNNIKKFIHISTPSLYDLTKKNINLNETDVLYTNHFPNHYIKTKFLAEQLVLSTALHTIILRPRGIFGPEDTAILPRFIQSNQKFGIPFINSAKNLVDLTYVDNVCEAIRLGIEADTVSSKPEIYNVTNGSPIEFFRLLNLIEKHLDMKIRRRKMPLFLLKSIAWILTKMSGKEPAITDHSLDLITKSITFDIQKIKSELGYEPLISLEEGLEKTIKSYKEKHGITGTK